jgi:Mechanosensitive ion channel
MTRHLIYLVLFLVCFTSCFVQLDAQETKPGALAAEPGESAPGPVVDTRPSTGDALASVQDSLKSVTAEIEQVTKAISRAPEIERPALDEKLKGLLQRRNELKADFGSIATGIDPTDYDQSTDEPFVLSDELDTLLRPIIEELKDLTEKPREIEKLRGELAHWHKRLAITQGALANLEKLPPDLSDELKVLIAESRKTWGERQKAAENRIQALSYQLEQAESNQPSLFNTIRGGFRTFFRSRGRNLVLSVLTAAVIFFGLRYLHQCLDQFAPWRRKGERPFYLRLVDVGLSVFSLFGAITGGLLVLYLAGDWVMLGVTLIVVFGALVAAKNAFPRFYDQARLLLNLGEAREGERVVYCGVPWKIERLSFFSILVNPQLRGGHVRLPVRQLSGLVSRPISTAGEIWFPCDEGDWIQLPDEGLGRVVAQTPEYVQMVKLGGAKVTIPTTDFLTKSPVNLSHNFRVSITFGIDYRHQAEATTQIPERLWAYLTRELSQFLGDHEKLLSLKVEFAQAGVSSLDYEIIADLDGALAPKIQAITRALHRFALDCCIEQGWELPFTQITLHNAYPQSEPEIAVAAKPKARLP